MLATGGGSSSVAPAADDTAASTSSARVEVNSGSLFEDDHGKGDRSSGGGNRWPSQETIALLQIRSDMDVTFRDSTLKGPLWDDISRKMGELGFNRSAKKCREKFENVYKYHKRTKDGRATKSKPDNKSYRFFDQLEALDQLKPNSSSVLPMLPPPPQLLATGNSNNSTVSSIHAANSTAITVPLQSNPTPTFANHNNSTMISFSHATTTTLMPPTPVTRPSTTISPLPQAHYGKWQQATSSSPSTSSDEGFVEVGTRNKRKRKWKGFFERLTNDVLKKQERLQKRFLEAIEKREQDRVLREESWKMQEMERIDREREILVRERSSAAAKDAAVISFLQNISEQQKYSSQNFRRQRVPVPPDQMQSETRSRNAPQKPLQPQPQLQKEAQSQPQQEQQQKLAQPAPLPLPALQPNLEHDGGNVVASPSRWPKAEISALINLRTSLDLEYHENGPKGPLWEDISSGMAKIGYDRSAKRCKEKWENINKYFKKVKGSSSKRRPEDSKTCPYFHLLDAIYKEKNKFDTVPIMVQPEQQWPLLPQDLQHQQKKMHDGNDHDDDSDDDDNDNDNNKTMITHE